jgi:hypothetical protein
MYLNNWVFKAERGFAPERQIKAEQGFAPTDKSGYYPYFILLRYYIDELFRII